MEVIFSFRYLGGHQGHSLTWSNTSCLVKTVGDKFLNIMNLYTSRYRRSIIQTSPTLFTPFYSSKRLQGIKDRTIRLKCSRTAKIVPNCSSFMSKIVSISLHCRHFSTFLSRPVGQTFYPPPDKNK